MPANESFAVTVTGADGRTAGLTADDLRLLAACAREARRQHAQGDLDQAGPHVAEAKPNVST